jgi:hypothetical protein
LFSFGADTAAGIVEGAGEVAAGTLGAVGALAEDVGTAGANIIGAGAVGSTSVVNAAGDALEDAATAAAKPFAIALGVIGVAAVAAYAVKK